MNLSLSQLKYELHLKIDAIEDEAVLLELLHSLPGKVEQLAQPDSYYAVKSRIANAEREIDAGNYVTQEELEEQAKEWFK